MNNVHIHWSLVSKHLHTNTFHIVCFHIVNIRFLTGVSAYGRAMFKKTDGVRRNIGNGLVHMTWREEDLFICSNERTIVLSIHLIVLSFLKNKIGKWKHRNQNERNTIIVKFVVMKPTIRIMASLFVNRVKCFSNVMLKIQK